MLAVMFLAVQVRAQLADGTVLTDNITGTEIQTQEMIDLFQILDSGQAVIVDAYATWCGPCWNVHQNGLLKDMHDLYGPDGTDQIRVIAVEVDPSTPEADIYGGGSSVGDWSAGVDYIMMNDAAWGQYFQVAYYPSIFVVRPDRTVVHMYGDVLRQYIFDRDFVATALGVSGKQDEVVYLDEITSINSCGTRNFFQRADFINMGTRPIETMKAELTFNGEVQQEFDVQNSVGIFQSGFIQTNPFVVTETTDIELSITEMNGEDVSGDPAKTISGVYSFPKVTERTFTARIITDFYPGETSGQITADGTVLGTFGPFQPGNADQFGGGGPDANIAHDFEITIPDDVDPRCINVIIEDSYGDGLTAYNLNSYPKPGSFLLDMDGNVIKENLESPSFTDNTTHQSGADLVSSNEEFDNITSINISPVPVYDNMNIEVQALVNEAYAVNITDVTGKVIYQNNFDIEAGYNSFKINMSGFNSGMFIMSISNAQGVQTRPFVKH